MRSETSDKLLGGKGPKTSSPDTPSQEGLLLFPFSCYFPFAAMSSLPSVTQLVCVTAVRKGRKGATSLCL